MSLDVHNGARIAPVSRGKLPGPRAIGELIEAVNGLLTVLVAATTDPQGKMVMSNGGCVLQLPGGAAGMAGVGPTMMQVVSYHQDAVNGDYLVCQPPGGGATVNVAVEPQLQSAIVTETLPDGTVWTY